MTSFSALGIYLFITHFGVKLCESMYLKEILYTRDLIFCPFVNLIPEYDSQDRMTCLFEVRAFSKVCSVVIAIVHVQLKKFCACPNVSFSSQHSSSPSSLSLKHFKSLNSSKQINYKYL